MAEIHGDAWGRKKMLGDLLGGKTDALSVFIEDEKKRVLGDIPALVLPAAPSG